MDAFWELVCAALPGKGCDCVLAGLKKLFGKIAAYTSRSLDDKMLENALSRSQERYSTYAYDGNFFDAVDETSWLILGVFWGHFGWDELWSRLKNVFKLIDLGLGFKCVCGYADDGWADDEAPQLLEDEKRGWFYTSNASCLCKVQYEPLLRSFHWNNVSINGLRSLIEIRLKVEAESGRESISVRLNNPTDHSDIRTKKRPSALRLAYLCPTCFPHD